MATGTVANEHNGNDRSGCMAECAPDPPAWDGMPSPKAVMTLSWEDVWFKLCDVLERQPTREEVESAFEEAAHRMEDGLIEDFWICIEGAARERAWQGKKLINEGKAPQQSTV